MKPCDKCAWAMVRGGVCAKCGHEDNEIPFSAVALLLGLAVLVITIALAVAGHYEKT